MIGGLFGSLAGWQDHEEVEIMVFLCFTLLLCYDF